jgi:predicted KAP-like P-loop ATPase
MSTGKAQQSPTLAERIYAHLRRTGHWPDPENIQREIANDGGNEEVRQTVMSSADLMFIGDQEKTLGLTLRGLATLPEARPVLEGYLLAVRRMVARYSNKKEEARYTREDLRGLALDEETEAILALILPQDSWPFGSGSSGEDWDFEISPRVLKAREIRDVDSFVALRHGEQEPAPEPATRPEPQPLQSRAEAEPSLNSDEPIERAEEDLLDRGGLAQMIASAASARTGGPGLVIGLTGSWGSGKTSLLNLIAEMLESEGSGIVLRFDPWLFSSSEELVLRFLRETYAQLRPQRRTQKLAQAISDYAQILAPLGSPALPWVAPATLSVTGLLRRLAARGRPTSAEAQRDAVEAELKQLGQRLVVLIDDLDRLAPGEVRDVVRLVKLIGDFPNTSYILAYDEGRVADALEDGDKRAGRAYLQKIIQVSFEVPETTPETRARLLGEAIGAAVGDLSRYQFDQDAYTNLFASGLTGLFITLRDIRRYTNTLPGVLALVGDEVELADLLAVEAIRSRLPESFDLMRAYKDALVRAAAPGLAQPPNQEAQIATQLGEILAAAGEHETTLREALTLLFPATGRHFGAAGHTSDSYPVWRRALRVAHPDVLTIYFAKTLPSGQLSATFVDAVFGALEDRESLQEQMSALSSEELEVLLERLEHYEHELPTNAPQIPIAVMYEQRQRLREQKHHVFDLGAEHKVSRVVLRLLRRLSPEQVAHATHQALTEISGLSERAELIRIVGYREDSGHQLASEADAQEFERLLFDEILTCDAQQLAGERDLAHLLWWVHTERPERTGTRITELAASDDFLLALLAAVANEHLTSTAGHAAVRRTFKLSWETLTTWMQTEFLVARVLELADQIDLKTLDDRTRSAVEQALTHARTRDDSHGSS